MYRVTSLLPLVLAASLCAASTDTSNGGSAAPLKRAEAGAGKTIHLRAGHEHAHGHHHRHDHHGRDAQTTFAPIDALTPAQACPAQAVTSCSSDAGATSACCVLRPDGALVHVQFWDVGLGVADSFGIHGLWPDKCSGGIVENCDSSRVYSAATIAGQLPSDLRSYMNTYWVSDDESAETFWANEWKEHGTCVSSLEPSCFQDYTTAAEVVPYFSTVVGLFQHLDVYGALTAAGINPSSSQTYSATAIQNAIIAGTTYTPDLVCTDGALSSVQFYLNAQGPLQDGLFVQGAPTRTSSCPAQVTWPPKTVGAGAQHDEL